MDGSGTKSVVSTTEEAYLLNMARCQCNDKLQTLMVEVSITKTSGALPLADVDFWVGKKCDDLSETSPKRDERCIKVKGPLNLQNFTSAQQIGFTTQQIVPGTNVPGCPAVDREQRGFYMLVQLKDSTQPDLTASRALTADTQGAPAPTDPGGDGGDSGVVLHWTVPSEVTNTGGYQIFCARSGGPVFAAGTFTPGFETAASLCGSTGLDGGVGGDAARDGARGDAPAAQSGDLSYSPLRPAVDAALAAEDAAQAADAGVVAPADALADALADGTAREAALAEASVREASAAEAGHPEAGWHEAGGSDAGAREAGHGEAGASDAGSDGGGGDLPPYILDLDTRYLCSETLAASTSEVRVTGLENMVEYDFWVVAFDKAKNGGTPISVGRFKAIPTEDFFERYRRAGGQARGDFCFVATAAYGSPDHPYVRVLRDFRDLSLLSNQPGRAMVESYYAHSPAAAAFLGRHPVAAAATRALLLPVVLAAGFHAYSPPALRLLALLVFLGGSALLWTVRRRLRLLGGVARDPGSARQRGSLAAPRLSRREVLG